MSTSGVTPTLVWAKKDWDGPSAIPELVSPRGTRTRMRRRAPLRARARPLGQQLPTFLSAGKKLARRTCRYRVTRQRRPVARSREGGEWYSHYIRDIELAAGCFLCSAHVDPYFELEQCLSPHSIRSSGDPNDGMDEPRLRVNPAGRTAKSARIAEAMHAFHIIHYVIMPPLITTARQQSSRSVQNRSDRPSDVDFVGCRGY